MMDTQTHNLIVTNAALPPDEGQLIQAAAFGDVKTVKYLVKKGIDVNTPDEITGNTPLIWSIINSKFKVAQLLIRMGADVHTAAFNDKTAYDWAEASYDSKILSLLMTKMRFSRKNATSKWKLIPNFIKRLGFGGSQKAIEDTGELLHEAAMQRTSQPLKTLLKSNADMNIQNHQGETPLHTAIKSHRASTTKFLLTSGADTNIQNADGSTPLHLAVNQNGSHKCDEILKNMVMKGADLYIEDAAGNTPLKQAFLNGDTRSAKIICKSLQHDSPYVLETFKLAIEFENIEVLRLLLKRWPQGRRDENNNTLLHIAVLKGKYEAINELVGNMDVNSCNDDGDTALHLAVERKLNEIVCLLLHNDINVNVQNGQGDTALHVAIQSNLLIFILIVEKCNKSIQNSDGNTAFHLASRYGKAEFVNLMINENKPTDDPYSSNYDVRTMEFKNLQNNRKFTALHYACAENNHKIVEKLLEIDVNTELKNCEEQTALDIAIEMNHFCLVSLFKGSKLCGNSLAMFVCPICIEIPISPNFVYQCDKGHIYCGSCDSNSKVFQCVQCGIPIRRKRRCRELENKLAIMFPNAELEGRVDSLECLFEH